MFPRLNRTSASLPSSQPVYIHLQPIPSQPFTSTSVSDESDDAPEWSYSAPTPPLRRRSVSVSSSSLTSPSSLNDIPRNSSWRDMLCIPHFPLAFLRTTSQSSSPSNFEVGVQNDRGTALIHARSPTPVYSPDVSPIHSTLISSDKGKGRAPEASPLLEEMSTGNENEHRPPSWTSAIPISLVID